MAKAKNELLACPMSIAINILGGKWKISILWHLSKESVRFNELQRLLTNITQKTLTMQLRELEKAGIIYRKIYPEIPPKVEYGLTKVGESLKPILSSMCEWGKEYQKQGDEIITDSDKF
jgi:DNA-binding HxlR family transcriptional regulator